MYYSDFLRPPLTSQELYVLLALAPEEGYAYRLKAKVMNASLGSVKLAEGTLYPLLTRLHDQGLIDMLGNKPAGKSGRDRMHYGISAHGSIRLEEELLRLRHVVKIAEANGLFSDDEIPTDIRRLLLDVRLGGDQ